MTLPRRKTLVYLALYLALFAVAVFWVGANTSWANTPPAVTPQGAALGNAAGKLFGNTVNIVGTAITIYGVLFVVYGALTMLMGITGVFLDNVFSWNVLMNPSTIPVVLDGWLVMRDLVNGLFVLIVLWIAITIIFNLDSWGGKRFLVRVIIAALLVNFSLLMVSAVFGFTNILTRPIYTAIGLDLEGTNPLGVSDVIVRLSNIHQTAKNITNEGVLASYKEELKKEAYAVPNDKDPRFASLWHAIGAPQEAQAGPVLAAAWVGLKWFGKAAAVELALWMLSAAVAVGTFYASWQTIMNLVVADGFLLVTLLAFCAMVVLLTLRLAAMVFLGVFAPVAFLALAIPRYGERFWNQWLSYLLNWAFMAPVFYFMLYLSLLFLQQIGGSVPGGQLNIAFNGNVYKMLNLVIFLILLWTGIITARKMGGAIADTALTFGKKLAGVGLGLGTGFAARHALPWAGRLATGLQEKINQGPALVRSTFGRGLTAYGLGTATRASRKQLQERQEAINKAGWTSAEIQQRLASGYFKSDTDVAAAIGVLKGRGDLDPQAGVRGYDTGNYLERAAGVYRGLKTDLVPLMRANPTIATQADFGAADFETSNARSAINEVLGADGRSGTAPTTDDFKEATKLLAWRRLRPQDVDTFDLNLLKEDDNKRRFLQVATGDHLSRLGRRDTRVAGDLQTYIDSPANRGLWDRFSDAKQQYFTSSAARSIGVWHVPPYAVGAIKDDKSFRALQPVVGISAPTGNPTYIGPTLVAGGTAPYTAIVFHGTPLPAGLRIDSATGQVVGSTVGIAKNSTFIVDYDITDSATPPAKERVSIHITIT